jgi:hypothetical protein
MSFGRYHCKINVYTASFSFSVDLRWRLDTFYFISPHNTSSHGENIGFLQAPVGAGSVESQTVRQGTPHSGWPAPDRAGQQWADGSMEPHVQNVQIHQL